jgi:DeoR/GlpR family transcriptional regulator of sugar metabolism
VQYRANRPERQIPMLTTQRKKILLARLAAEGQLVAKTLALEFETSEDTIRRDLRELAAEGRLQRVHGGALPASAALGDLAVREQVSTADKAALGRYGASLVQAGQVVILDGGTTALALVDAIPPGLRATFVTHAPPVAAALGAHRDLDVLVVGGTLDPEAMVSVGAGTLDAYRRVTADLCFLGVWSLHAEHGISGRYHEEAEVRRVLVERADRVVGLCTTDKLGTVSAFGSGPATALTHLATEPDAPEALLAPFRDLGIRVLN